jgi:hypothetical protein
MPMLDIEPVIFNILKSIHFISFQSDNFANFLKTRKKGKVGKNGNLVPFISSKKV